MYSDSNNIYEALKEIEKHTNIPKFGVRETLHEQRTDYASHEQIINALKNEMSDE